MLTAETLIPTAPEAVAPKPETDPCRPRQLGLVSGRTSRNRRSIPSRNTPPPDTLALRAKTPPREHPLQRLDLCRIERQGRVSAATAAFVHALLGLAGRRPALLTPEGGLMAGRLFPQRPSMSEAPEWERLLATHVRSGGDCLIIEEDSEIRELLSGIPPRSALDWPASPKPWVRAQALHWRGSRVQAISHEGVARTAHLPLVGDSNLKALDRALSLVIHAGCCPSRSLATLPLLDPPTGLLEPVHAGQPYGVFVDRAASAADLAELLAEARTLSGRRILLVTGIRGNSSPEERRAMGAASAAADEVVFTSDNPRHSPLQTLLNDLREGLGGGGIVEPDRRAAITRAIRGAKSDDLVIIAGKGGRPVQEVGSAVMPWDDRLHARDALAGRGWVGDAL
jgi:UDP-N-acetylmuramyl tripeptide synthase